MFLRRLLSGTTAAVTEAIKPRYIPPPNATVPDVSTFLARIKRGCEQYVTKISNWNELFTMNSRQMELKGIPCQQRKLILRWVQKYREGIDPYYIKPSPKVLAKEKAKRKAAEASLKPR